jgi:hypothetical protein
MDRNRRDQEQDDLTNSVTTTFTGAITVPSKSPARGAATGIAADPELHAVAEHRDDLRDRFGRRLPSLKKFALSELSK